MSKTVKNHECCSNSTYTLLVEIVGFYRWCKVPISFMRGYEWKKWQNFTRKIILFEKSTILYMLHIWHFLTIFGSFWLFFETGIWQHWKNVKIFFFYMWNLFYNRLFLNFMIFKHFHYMLVPILVCYSETAGVQPPIFGYVFCFGEIKKTSRWKPKTVISVNR